MTPAGTAPERGLVRDARAFGIPDARVGSDVESARRRVDLLARTNAFVTAARPVFGSIVPSSARPDLINERGAVLRADDPARVRGRAD